MLKKSIRASLIILVLRGLIVPPLFIFFAACANGNTEKRIIQVIPTGDIPPDPVNTSVNPYETAGGGISQFKTHYSGPGVLVRQDGYILKIEGPFGRIEYNVSTGFSKIFKPDSNEDVLKGVYAELRPQAQYNVKTARTFALTRNGNFVSVTNINDNFGSGVKVSVRSWSSAITVWQNYYIYPYRKYLLLDAETEVKRGTSVNYFAVLKAGLDNEKSSILNLKPSADPRFLFVPFDNDDFVRYNSRDLKGSPASGNIESCEVTAIYDNTSRKGLVIGAVTHNVWKTGIRARKAVNEVAGLNVFGGYTSFYTRDVASKSESAAPRPHGTVFGAQVNSPKILLGFFDDWRDGMEEYGRACGIVSPPLNWPHQAPFGWNSWAAYKNNPSYQKYIDASDFFKNYLTKFNSGSDSVFINLDSWWDRLSEAERPMAAAYVRNNLQNAGIYFSPFVAWQENIELCKTYGPEVAPGLPRYTWFDLILKDNSGNPVRYFSDQGWALDLTHPGTLAYAEYRIRRYREWGFSYVKLDFLTHGALEGNFYDKTKATTGIQAYNYGMRKILESIGVPALNGDFFISLSISPIFPSQYAHSRRISCDVFGELDDTEYMLNSLSYGWWINNSVYPYNDPDHIVLYKASGNMRTLTLNESTSAYIAAAITGGIMLNSDDISVQAARERLAMILNNEKVNSLAASSRTFRPTEGNTGTVAADVFVRDDRGIDGSFYIAVFNFGNIMGMPFGSKTKDLNFERMGLDKNAIYTVDNLITGAREGTAKGAMHVSMAAGECKLFELRLQ